MPSFNKVKQDIQFEPDAFYMTFQCQTMQLLDDTYPLITINKNQNQINPSLPIPSLLENSHGVQLAPRTLTSCPYL